MIDHLSIEVGDIEAARRFFDPVMRTLGAQRLMNFEADETKVSGYGRDDEPAFWIAQAGAGKARPLAGHIAFRAADRAAVDAFYRAALAAGAADNGPPGLRQNYYADYYAAFVIDPEGNRLEAVCHKPA